MTEKTFFYFIFHFLLAFFPLIVGKMFGGMRTDWYVTPVLVVNGFIQGGAFVYRLYGARVSAIEKSLKEIKK